MGAIDEYSTAATPLRLAFGETMLSAATGFFWRADERHFLITNWHNCSGRNPNSNKHISPSAAEPDSVWIFPFERGSLDSRLMLKMPLLDADGRPLWLVHPLLGKSVDVVALPIPDSMIAHADLRPINLMPTKALRLQVGADVFVLGYPLEPKLALAAPMSPALLVFPVWKRGSIASEPNLLIGPQRHVLIDTASRPGMSGSPVVLRHWTTHVLETGNVEMSASPATRFIGVYSGRLGTTDALDAQLGILWPASLVGEIVQGSSRDVR